MNRRQFLKLMAASAVTLGVGMTLDGVAVEPSAIEVNTFPIFGEGGREAVPSLRIAFMSDFHRSWTTPREIIQRAVRVCQKEKPDLILLGGDYITSDTTLAFDCAEDLGKLQAPAGIYFVLGNHDHWHGEKKVRQALLREGFADMTNRSTSIGKGIFLCGVDDQWAGNPDVSRAFRGTDKGLRLVFSHNPRIFPEIRHLHCVAICGHTHGGQVNIPFVPNPYLLSWKKYVRGWFREGSSRLYVNRGIGTLILPVRFRCRPEITILTL